ncbi:MAG: hypothetical protein KA201_09180 [Kofleriaceae bacterium]|nr:hypothetical protein [Kofleriaceae bacterium]
MSIHSWRRFWCARDATYNLGDGGFLIDPESDTGRYLQASAVALDRKEATACLILLGEPGIGKSVAIAQEHARLLAAGQRSILVDLARVSSNAALKEALRPAASGTGPVCVFLDGFDEGLSHNLKLASDVFDALVSLGTASVRLRVASRTLDWPLAMEALLRERLGSTAVEAYEMLPLRRVDVSVAAASRGIASDLFLHCVQERDVAALAVRPLSLRFLLEAYSANGTLPHSKVRLFDEGMLILCSEEGAWQRGGGRPNPDVFRRRVVAARIAAMTTFANLQTIERGAAARSGALASEDIAGGAEVIAGASYEIDERSVEDTLNGTALFAARGAAAFGWSHQSYREFLAAWYLAQRNPTLDKVTSIYFPRGVRRRVPGPLREVAAWHATLAPDVFALLVDRDPEVLLNSDTAAVAPESRSQLARALLERLDSMEAVDSNYWQREYRRLAHPGLAEQLRPYIGNIGANIMVRRASMDIAWACGVTSVIDALISVLRNGSEDVHPRECAARALGELGGEEAVRAFRAMLDDGFLNDPNDEVRGHALNCLWPAQIDSSAMFAALHVPQRDDYLGTYQRFLDALPDKLGKADIQEALEWVERIGDVHGFSVERVAQQIVDVALSHLGSPGVLPPLCRIIVRSFRTHDGPWDSERSGRERERPQLTLDQRRGIAAALISTVGADTDLGSHMIFSGRPLLLADDLPWLTAWAARETAVGVLEALGRCVAALYMTYGYPRDADTADAVVSVESSAFQGPLRKLLDPIELLSEAAARQKAAWENSQRPRRQRSAEEPEPNRWLVSAPELDRFEAGELFAWVRFLQEFARGGHASMDGDAIVGVPVEQRARVTAAALRFLTDYSSPDPVWIDEGGSYPWGAIAAHGAFQWLALVDALSLDQLPAAAWRQWAHTIVGTRFPMCPKEVEADLLRRAQEQAPSELCDSVVRIVRRENRNDGFVSVVHVVPRPLGSDLRAELLRLLDELGDRSLEDVLEALVSSGAAEALAYASAAIEDSRSGRAAHAACVVLARDGSFWPAVISRMQRDRAFVEQFSRLVAFDEDRVLSPLATLDERHVAELHLVLRRMFPAEREHRRLRGGLMVEMDHVSRLRERMIRRLVNAKSERGIEGLEWLIEQEPGDRVLKWHLVKAKENFADAAWQPLSLSAFWDALEVVAVDEVSIDGVARCDVVLSGGDGPQSVGQALQRHWPGARVLVVDSKLSLVLPVESVYEVQSIVEKDPLLRREIQSVRYGKEWIYEAVPVSDFHEQPSRDASTIEMQKVLSGVHVLVETATDTETAAVLSAMRPLPGQVGLVVGGVGIATYTVGAIGRYAVAHVQADMGPDGQNSATLATSDAIGEVRPRAVFLVGIAFGIDRAKQRLGDVLVAQYVTGYEMTKLRPESIEGRSLLVPGCGQVEDRSTTLPGNVILCERFKAHKRSWRFLRSDGSRVSVLVGEVLSGGKLVNNREFRDWLALRFPSALGGEMEGIGAYGAALRKGVPVLLVKAICDWADGLKNDRAQAFAAAAAVGLVQHVLDKPDALSALDAPELEVM